MSFHSYREEPQSASSSDLEVEPASKKQRVESTPYNRQSSSSSSSSSFSSSSSTTSSSSASSLSAAPMEFDAADVSSSSPTSNRATTISSPSLESPLLLLYTDVIHCILRFADFDELGVMTQVNHLFRNSVRTLKPTFDDFEDLRLPKPKRKLDIPYRSSALLPHVSGVNASNLSNLHPRTQMMRLAPFTRLQRISDMKLQQFPLDFRLSLPSTLTCLKIHFDERSLQSVINAVCRIVKLEQLSLRISSTDSDNDGPFPLFAPLIRLTSLDSLTLYLIVNGRIRRNSDLDVSNGVDPRLGGFLETVSQMPSLRSLYFGGATIAALEILTQESNKLQQLEEIETICQLDETYLRLIAKLPGLTALDYFEYFTCLDLSSLSLLTNLTSLSLSFEENQPIPSTENLISSIAHLKLILLKLEHPTIDADQLKHILSLFPLLEDLSLIALDLVDSLSPLETGPITQSLVSLSIHHCSLLRTDELSKLRSLLSLTHLDIYYSFDEDLCSFARQLLTPGSPNLIIPTLTNFDYIPQSELE